MENRADPGLITSSETSWSGSTLFSKEDKSQFGRTASLRVGSHVVFAWIHCTDVRIHCTAILIEFR